MDGPKVIFTLPFLGGLKITETVVDCWIIMAIITILCFVLTHKLEKIPRKKTQIIAEKIVETFDSMVKNTMGSSWQFFTPYIMALFLSSVLGSLSSLVGLRAYTSDINTILIWAVMTFVMIHFFGIKKKGLLKHLKGLTEPIPFITPLNIVSEFAKPVSMTFRHFGNILAGSVITSLIYSGLAAASSLIPVIGKKIPIFQLGVPAFLSLYFDLFTSVMQAFIFCMLTMVFISTAAEE